MRAVLVGFTGLVLLGFIAFSALISRAEHIQQDILERSQTAMAALGADWVTVRAEGRDLRLSGDAPSQEAKARVVEAARTVPGVRSVGGRIRVDEPVSPFVWRLERSSGEIVLSGVVPDRASKQALRDLAQIAFGRPVSDRTKIARGAPEGGWMRAASFAVEQLAALGKDGEAVLEDAGLTIAGENLTLEPALAERFQKEAEAALVAPFEAKLEIFHRTAEEVATAATDNAVSEEADPEEAEAAAAEETDSGTPTRLGLDDCQQQVDAVLAEGGIACPSGRREPTAESRALIARLGEALSGDCGRYAFEVAGHTDSSGKADANQRLSEVRAQAVAEALAESGLPASSLNAVGYGSSEPIADNATPEGRARNRRIEITVMTEMLAEN